MIGITAVSPPAFDAGVREAYEWAVDVSEAHQDEDDHQNQDRG